MGRWLAALCLAGCGRLGFDVQTGVTGDGGGQDGDGGAEVVTLERSASAWATTMTTARMVQPSIEPAAGSLLVVSVSTSFQAVTSISDTAGNSYTRAPNSPSQNSPTYCNIFVYYARDIASAPGFTTTVNVGSSDYVSVALHVLGGTDRTSPLVSDQLCNGTSTSPACGPVQSDTDGSAYIASLCHNGTRTTTFGSGFEITEAPTESGNNNSALVTAHRTGDAVPTSAAAMLSSSDGWQLHVAAFRP